MRGADPAYDISARYERHSQAWDRLRGRTLFEKAWLDRFLALIHMDGTILDLGCGSGEPIARHVACAASLSHGRSAVWTKRDHPASHAPETAENDMAHTISSEQALIYVMVMMSGVEGRINNKELKEIGVLVQTLPVFRNFDRERLTTVAQECGEILQDSEGLQTALGLVREALPPRLCETAYALAVEVAASDLAVGKEELRFLAILRDTLGLDKLVTAAIERSAIARYQSI